MTLEEIKKTIEKIRKDSGHNAEIRTIALMEDFIDAIANGTCEDFVQCAQEITELWK